MTTAKKTSTAGSFVLAFLVLGLLAGCSNDRLEARREPAKTGSAAPGAAPLAPLEIEMLQVAAKGDNARVKELLDKGVNVNMRGSDRNTPIMEAAYAPHLDTVKLLLDHGADLSAKKNDGATPMGLARSKDVLDLFKNVSALVEASGKGDVQAVSALVEKGTPVNGLNQTGSSALAEASWNGKIEIVKMLIARGADPTIKKADGATPVSLATSQKHPDVVALLNDAIAKQAKPGK
jgi:ankyrin repeat protein